MQKPSLIPILLACTIMLTACQSSDSSEDSQDYFTESIQATDAIFNCLSSKDAEGIKALLCERLNNVPDVDTQIQGLLDGIDGSILPTDMNEVRSVDTSGYSKKNGIYTNMSTIGTVRRILTDTGKTYQHLLVFYCFVDKRNPDLEGVYAITLRENDDVVYEVFIPERTAEPEEDYGTVYTPDGPRPATKEEQEAMLGEGATE